MGDDAIPDWHVCRIERQALKQLTRRSDWAGLAQYGSYFAVLALLGTLTSLVWGSAWALLPLFFYATAYGFGGPFNHESHHGTAFKSHLLNEIAHQVTGILMMREPIRDRWMHTQHHTHTYYSGRDPEIQSTRPPRLWHMAVDLFKIPYTLRFLGLTLRNAAGALDDEARRIAPAEQHGTIVWSSRLSLAVYAGIVILAVVLESWLPVVLTFGARIAGAWLHTIVSMTQHVGMPENVADYRLNTRTVRLNPLLRWLYCNMNYHVEHHMYPMVPFHALPRLHDRLRAQMPAPYVGLGPALREVLAVLWTQRREPKYSVRRALPAAA